jgi:tetratricopeptide (TPR) repeat protein
MLYGFRFDDAIGGRRDPPLRRSQIFSANRQNLHSAAYRSIMLFLWGMTLLVFCSPMVCWSQEPCTLGRDTDATAYQTQAEAADAQGILFLRNKNTHCALASFTQEIRASPEAWQGHYHAGLAYLDLSDAHHAVLEFQLAAGKASSRAEIPLALGIAQEALGENGKAELSYRTAYRLEPKSPEIIRHLAAILGKEKQSGAAVTYWREAATLAPSDPDLRLSLATALMDDGQNDAAATQLNEMVQQNPKSGLALLNLGAVLYREGKYSESADAYRRASQLDAVSDSAKLSLAKVLITLVHFDEAKPLLEPYVRNHPASMEAHYLLGITYQGLGMLVQSTSELQRAIQLKDTDFDSQYKLGSVLREEGKYEEAISHLKRAVTLKPDSQEAHFQLDRAYHQTNQPELADQETLVFQRLQKTVVDQRRATVLENEGALAAKDGDLQKAVSAYKAALQLAPQDAKVRYDLALVFEKLKDRSSERALLLEAAALNPSIADVHNQLGFLDLTAGDAAAAEQQFQAALRADPGMADALGNLGVLYGQQGKLAAAEHLLCLAVESDPGYEKGFMNLGLILAAEGRFDEAHAQLRKALQLSATDAVALHAMSAIEAHLPTPTKP